MLVNDKTVSGKFICELPWYSREKVLNKCNMCKKEEEILLLSYNKKNNKDICHACLTSERQKRYLTDDDKSMIIKLYDGGEIIDKIAKIIKKPEHRISFFLNEIGYIKNNSRVHFKCSVCLEKLDVPNTSSVCRKCISIRETTYKINISVEEYFNLNKYQNNVCKICKKQNKKMRLSVDHCHRTGAVRGLLCGKCNAALGFFKDDINLIKNAIKYVKIFNQNLSE